MLFKSNMVTQASGSIGGLTASRNRGGMYFRARSVPTNPNTIYQQAVRNIFATLSAGWSVLDEEDRDRWSVFATNTPVINALGDQIYLTGQQMYIRNNAARLQAGLSTISAGPIIFGSSTITPTPAVAPELGTQTLGFAIDDEDEWASTDGGALLVYMSRPQPVARAFFKGPYRYAGKVLGVTLTPPATSQTVPVPFAISEGQVVFTRFIGVTADGRLTQELFYGPSLATNA